MKALNINKLDTFGGKSVSTDLPEEGHSSPGEGRASRLSLGQASSEDRGQQRHAPLCWSPDPGSGACVYPKQQAAISGTAPPRSRCFQMLGSRLLLPPLPRPGSEGSCVCAPRQRVGPGAGGDTGKPQAWVGALRPC